MVWWLCDFSGIQTSIAKNPICFFVCFFDFSGGGGEGGPMRGSKENYTFPRLQRGSNTYHITCDFPGGGSGLITPLWIHLWDRSPAPLLDPPMPTTT